MFELKFVTVYIKAVLNKITVDTLCVRLLPNEPRKRRIVYPV